DCRLFCSELSEERVFIYTGGCFGFARQPAAFDVVTRAMKHELPRIIQGDGDAYTDDFFGMAEDSCVDSDMGACEELALSLLGPEAIAADRRKSKKGKRLEIIGRCLLKALHGYLSVDEYAPMKLKTLQRMASWGVRYGEINTLMHPFTAVLYNESRGRTNPHCSITLSSTGRRAVQMLRIITLLIAVDEPSFARPFSSWEIPDKLSGLFGHFDNSLLGLGVYWYILYASGIVRLVGCAAVDIRCLGFGTDASFQNVAEYIAAIAAVRGAKLLRDRGLLIDGAPPKGIWLKGDSMTALSWMDKGRVKSTLAINASMVAVMQSVHSNMPVLGGFHVPAESNPLANEISRIAQSGRNLAELVRVTPELQGVEILDLKMGEVLPLCDPHKEVNSEAAFGAFWTRSTPSGVPRGGGTATAVAIAVPSRRRRVLPASILAARATIDPLTGAPQGRWFSSSQLQAMPAFVGVGMVTAGTTIDYERGWKLWRSCLLTLDTPRRPDEYLRLVQEDENKVRLMLLFAMSLYSEKAWRGRQITRLFAHVAHFLRIAFAPISFLKHPIVGAARLSVRHSPAEMRVFLTAKSKRALAPMCIEMLDFAREALWAPQTWDSAKALDARAAYLAIALLVDTGKRVSSITGPTYKKGVLVADHGILWSDLEVISADPESDGTVLRAGGRSLRRYLNDQPEPLDAELRRYPGVLGFTVKFYTEKVRVSEDQAQVDAIPFGRINDRENQFLQDVMDWARHCGDVGEGDYVFTRVHPDPRPGVAATRRLLQRTDVAAAKVLRHATTANGMLADERNRRAGWVPGSRTVDAHYNKLVHNRGVFALGGEAFTLRDVGRLTQAVVTDSTPALGAAPRPSAASRLAPAPLSVSQTVPDFPEGEGPSEAPDDEDDDLHCLLSCLADTAF
ncbi:hypothetical protein B484DRAFT_404565, partial [Ochromonadaceae sp. CCMP2298]